MSEQKKPLHFDFNIPEQARDFLSGLVMRGKGRITGVSTKESGWMEFKDMTDDQAMNIATSFCKDFMSLDPEQRTIYWEPLQ